MIVTYKLCDLSNLCRLRVCGVRMCMYCMRVCVCVCVCVCDQTLGFANKVSLSWWYLLAEVFVQGGVACAVPGPPLKALGKTICPRPGCRVTGRSVSGGRTSSTMHVK